MPPTLKVLLVEDNPADSDLALRELRRAGFMPEWKRVDTEEDYLGCLPEGFDLILSDFDMPLFNGLRALDLLKKSGLEIPFILVSGTIGEETAVAAMKQGAADYLLKDRLTRLGPAVSHALEQGRLRQERKLAEEARRRAEARYQRIFNNAVDGIYQSTPDGRFLTANPALARILGYDSPEELRDSVTDISRQLHVNPERRAAFQALLLEQGVVFGFEAQLKRKDGTAIWTSTNARAVQDDGGGLLYEGIMEDITERKQMEEKFLRMQRVEAIGTLASGIAHDLNNILAPMLMAAGLLKDKVTAPRDQAILTMIESGAQRGAAIIKQLLSFSRGAASERVSIQLKHLLKEMTQIMHETFPRNIVIEQDVPNDLWIVQADATQIHQVLLNLCVNARDAMPKGGKLTLRAGNLHLSERERKAHGEAKPGPHVLVTVSDTGHGIPPEIIDRIFDPFFTTKDPGKGTGLGLSTVLGIAKSHGGAIAVESDPSRGTSFKIYLPATGDSPDSGQIKTGPLLAMGHGELILLVDDEAAIRETTGQILREHGYRIIAANDGEEALKLFVMHIGSVRLVLTDVMMPGMGGLELIRSLRILEPSVKLVATSGLEQEGQRDELEALGVKEILSKPCPQILLLEAVNRALAAKL